MCSPNTDKLMFSLFHVSLYCELQLTSGLFLSKFGVRTMIRHGTESPLMCHGCDRPPGYCISERYRPQQTTIIELKSNDSARPLEQMWFGHARYCCFGKQKIGLFTRAEVKFVNHEEFEEWESKQQNLLQKLAWLLQELRTVVKEEMSEGSAVLVSLGEGELIEVFEAKTSVDTLPKEIVEEFWAWWYTVEATA
jgi:hypothetical protein